MDRWWNKIVALKTIKKRYIGIVLGIVLWAMLIWVGFFPTLLLVILSVLGYACGRFLEERDNWLEVITRLWSTDRFDR